MRSRTKNIKLGDANRKIEYGRGMFSFAQSPEIKSQKNEGQQD